jgi:Bardet-Biedl syndrome 7 protein
VLTFIRAVEIWSITEGIANPRMLYRKLLNESVQSVESGYLHAPDKMEVVLATYSGKVISLQQQPAVEAMTPEQLKVYKSEANADKKINATKLEIEKLQQKVSEKKARYQRISNELISQSPQFKVNQKFVLNPSDSTYILTIEVNSNLDCLILQSDIPLDVEDYDKNVSIMSKSLPDPEQGNQLLATCRIMEPVSRLSIKVLHKRSKSNWIGSNNRRAIWYFTSLRNSTNHPKIVSGS